MLFGSCRVGRISQKVNPNHRNHRAILFPWRTHFQSLRGKWNTLFGLTCWKIWLARNKLIFNSEHVQVTTLICVVKVMTKFNRDATNHISRDQIILTQKSCHNISWSKPPELYVKLNCDGALKNSGATGAGRVIRDSKGKWLIGCARNIGRCTSLQVELWALLDGLEIAWYELWALLNMLKWKWIVY